MKQNSKNLIIKTAWKISVIIILMIPFSGFSQEMLPYSQVGEKIDACGNACRTNHISQKSVNSLMNDYDIIYTKLDIEALNESSYINGNVLIRGLVTADLMNAFCIGLSNNMNIEQVLFNGNATAFTHENDEITVELDVELQKGEEFSTTIVYSGNGYDENEYAGGFYFTEDDDDFNYQPLSFSFTQPFGADLWFPCKQDLTDKIDSLDIYITTASSYKVSANGLLKNTIDLGDNKTRYEWETRYPTAYYLVVFNIFNYEENNFYTQPDNMDEPILIQNFMVDQNHINSMKETLDKTAGAMNLYSTLLGPYPFKDEKYGHSIWGKGFGMEHQTMTSMPYSIDFRRLSHELSHQWFGNSTTCATWQDIWLNEGFASYFDYLALKLLVSESSGENRMLYYHNKAMTNRYGSVYVPDDYATDASRIFDYKMSYCKGAAVVKMLRFELQDDEVFWQSLRNYLEVFKDSAASTDEFREIVEETSGKDFEYFFNQWIYGEGYPKYSGLWYQKNDSLFLKINQFASYPSQTQFFDMLMQYKVNFEGGDTVILLRQGQKTQKFGFPFNHTVTGVDIDPFNEVLNEDYGLTELDVSGISSFLKPECTVFPNPFSEKLNILFDEENTENTYIKIFDISGKLVLRENTNMQTAEISTDKLRSGIYILEVRNGDRTYRERLVRR